MAKSITPEQRRRIIELHAKHPALPIMAIAVRMGLECRDRARRATSGPEARGAEGEVMPPPASNANRLKVLKLRADNPKLTASQIALRVGLATRTVQRILEAAT